MNNTGLSMDTSRTGMHLILDGSSIPSTLDENEIEYLNSLTHDTALCELLEHYLCNGWQTVDVALFGGLVLESSDGVLYADVKHQTHNAVERLLAGENYQFHRVESDA